MNNLLAICVIVFSPGMNEDITEKYWHEMAHCNGWEHPNKISAFGEAYKPPKKYLYKYSGPIKEYSVSVKQAQKLCGGHFACQWFERTGK